jgi:hypothetical protein
MGANTMAARMSVVPEGLLLKYNGHTGSNTTARVAMTPTQTESW